MPTVIAKNSTEHLNWSGFWPSNRIEEIASLRLNGAFQLSFLFFYGKMKPKYS